MKERNKRLPAAIALYIGQAVLYLFGGLILFWSLICYLGGPCPRPGDLHLHLMFGTLWLVVGLALIFAGKQLGRLATRQWEKRRMSLAQIKSIDAEVCPASRRQTSNSCMSGKD